MRHVLPHRFDFTPFYRSIVGFDRMADLIDSAVKFDTAEQSYPPYNIERLGEDSYRIEVAVAGFSDKDLSVELRENTLMITGQHSSKAQNEDKNFLHRGIAERNFERRFHLADHVKVKNAGLHNGLLMIELVREVPDALKPRKIPILSSSDGNHIEADSSTVKGSA